MDRKLCHVAKESYHCHVTVQPDFSSDRYLSELLFGDNLEHTRDCINTGLSAQMLKNRKFVSLPSHSGCALGWEPIGRPYLHVPFQEVYTRHHESYRMVRAHECHSQKITGFDASRVGIAQKGLWIEAGQEYEFVLVAWAFEPMQVLVSLKGEDGHTICQEEILVSGREFCTYPLTLRPENSCPNAALEISFPGPGTLNIGAVSMMRADNFHGMRRDVIARMKELGIRILRWPGGNFSGEYHWKDGLLPRDQRAPFQSYLWIETQPHTWGYDYHEINTDDFVALCREIGAEPFITINPTWNTPRDSADWVEYCNGDASTPYGKLRAERGHEKPYGVKFWSLGNEFGYGHMEGTNGAEQYAQAVRLHAESMRKVCPELRLCSSGPYPNTEWTEKSALALQDVSGLVSLHHYAELPEFMDPSIREEEYYRFIAKPDTEYLPLMRQLHQQLDGKLQISLDEWNAWAAWYRLGSIAEGIFAARFLNMLYQNAEACGIGVSCHFESVNEGAILVLPDRALLTPVGQAIASMRHHAGARVLSLIDDAVVTEKGGILTATLINRSYDREKQFSLKNEGKVLLAELYAGEGVVPNTRFQVLPLAAELSDGTLTAVLPPHSIALIQMLLE